MEEVTTKLDALLAAEAKAAELADVLVEAGFPPADCERARSLAVSARAARQEAEQEESPACLHRAGTFYRVEGVPHCDACGKPLTVP